MDILELVFPSWACEFERGDHYLKTGHFGGRDGCTSCMLDRRGPVISGTAYAASGYAAMYANVPDLRSTAPGD